MVFDFRTCILNSYAGGSQAKLAELEGPDKRRLVLNLWSCVLESLILRGIFCIIVKKI